MSLEELIQKGEEKENKLEVQLVNYQGFINTKVFATIDEKGGLELYGFDTGNLPPGDMFDDDVEYMLNIPAEEKEKVRGLLISALLCTDRQVPENLLDENKGDVHLLELLGYHYQGQYNAFNDFKTLLEKNQITFSFNWG